MKVDSYYGDNSLHTMVHWMHHLADLSIEKNEKLTEEALFHINNFIAFASKHNPYLDKLNKEVNAIASLIPEDRRSFFNSHLLAQTQFHFFSITIMESYARSLIAYNDGDINKALKHAQFAYKVDGDLYDVLRQTEYGKWAGWYMGERFYVLHTHRNVEKLIYQLRNEEIPPYFYLDGYKEMYNYQLRFNNNFPLLYPSEKK